MSNSLVFGGTGFIGGHVARKLRDRGNQVSVFKRAGTKPVGLDGVSFVVGDLEQIETVREAARGFSRIYFCAGYYPSLSRDIEKQIAIAGQQFRDFLDAVPSAADVVYLSSFSTIGHTTDGAPADETTPYDDAKFPGIYYRIKRELERIALEKADARSGKLVMVNPTAIFGDYDLKPTSSRLVIDAAQGRMLFKVKGLTNAVDIHDVASGMIAAMEKGRSKERYILGGENTTLEDFVDTVCDVVAKPHPWIPVPIGVVRTAARASEAMHAWLKRPGMAMIPVVGVDFMQYGMHVSSEKARRELGYTHGTYRPALERAYRWFTANGYL